MRNITPEIETEAAIYADGTKFTKADIIRAYREHLDTADEPLDIQRFCEQVLGIDAVGASTERVYRIAYLREDGSWDIVQAFLAAGDNEANAYAEENCHNDDWYVLDAAGRNINGGIDG